MVADITTGFSTVLGYIGSVVTALTGQNGQLADLVPVIALGIAATFVVFAIGGIKSLIKGY